jgi:thiol-disulfide isomerase/thioredoxin
MKKNFFILFVLSLVFISCNSKNTTDKNSDNIVFIFENPPVNTVFNIPSGGMLMNNLDYGVLYVNELGLLDGVTPGNNDTLRISSKKEKYINVQFVHKAIDKIDLIFKIGDTVTVTYKNNELPYFKSRYGDNYSRNYNLWNDHLRINSKFGMDAFYLTKDPYFRSLDRIKKTKPELYNAKFFIKKHKNYINIDSLTGILTERLPEKINLLDSLYNSKEISSYHYSFYKQILSKRTNEIENNNDKTELALSDTLLNRVSYYGILKGKIYSINKEHSIPFIKETGHHSMNYCVLFDTVQSKISGIYPKSKDVILYYCLEGITENFGANDIQNYGAKYLEFTGDTARYNKLMQQQNIDFSLGDSLLLDDIDGKRYSFNKIISKHRGKVIYIDFWASWCKPCKDAMPHAKKLREEYQDKDVTFIYLGFRDNKNSWKRAITKNEINTNCENYFIVNPKSAKIIEDLAIKAIPRYIIFDKKGDLVYKNAPGSEGQRIRDVLKELL